MEVSFLFLSFFFAQICLGGLIHTPVIVEISQTFSFILVGYDIQPRQLWGFPPRCCQSKVIAYGKSWSTTATRPYNDLCVFGVDGAAQPAEIIGFGKACTDT